MLVVISMLFIDVCLWSQDHLGLKHWCDCASC